MTTNYNHPIRMNHLIEINMRKSWLLYSKTLAISNSIAIVTMDRQLFDTVIPNR